MTWQDPVVFAIVGAAVVFLVRRVLPARAEPPQTFVPIDQLKRRSDDTKACH